MAIGTPASGPLPVDGDMHVLRSDRDVEIYLELLRDYLLERVRRDGQVLVPRVAAWNWIIPEHIPDRDPQSPEVEVLDETPEPDPPHDKALHELVGPFWSARQVQELLEYNSRQALAGARKRGAVLGVKGADGKIQYPTSQFHRTGGEVRVKPGQQAMFRVLRDVDSWSVAKLMHDEAAELEGMSPLEWERAGHPIEALQHLAQHVLVEGFGQ